MDPNVAAWIETVSTAASAAAAVAASEAGVELSSEALARVRDAVVRQASLVVGEDARRLTERHVGVPAETVLSAAALAPAAEVAGPDAHRHPLTGEMGSAYLEARSDASGDVSLGQEGGRYVRAPPPDGHNDVRKDALRALSTIRVFDGEACTLPADFVLFAATLRRAVGGLDEVAAVRLVADRFAGQAAALFDAVRAANPGKGLPTVLTLMRKHYEPCGVFDPLQDVINQVHQGPDEPVSVFHFRLTTLVEGYGFLKDGADMRRAFVRGLNTDLQSRVLDALVDDVDKMSITALVDIARRREATARKPATSVVRPVVAAVQSRAEFSEAEVGVLADAVVQRLGVSAVAQESTQRRSYPYREGCYYCRAPGHIKAACPQLAKKSTREKDKSVTKYTVLVGVREREKAEGNRKDTPEEPVVASCDTLHPGEGPQVADHGEAVAAVSIDEGPMTLELTLVNEKSSGGVVTALVDTGSAVSLVSAAIYHQFGEGWQVLKKRTGQHFVSASGNSLVPLAQVEMVLSLHTGQWKDQKSLSGRGGQVPIMRFPAFVVEDLQPEFILGADFLQHFVGKIACATPSLEVVVGGRSFCVLLGKGGPELEATASAVRRRLDLDRMGALFDIGPDEEVTTEAVVLSREETAEVEVQCVPTLENTDVWKEEVRAALSAIKTALPSEVTGDVRRQVERLLDEEVALAARPLSVPRDRESTQLPYKLVINLVPNAVPFSRSPYPLSEARCDSLNKQLTELLELGFVQKSESPWSHPVLMVPKGEGEFRMCVDLRGSNAQTVKDSYPIPRINEVLDQLSGVKYYAHLDLRSGFWQVEVEEDSRKYTAFTTKSGLFEWVRMPFGVKNAPVIFQRIMETVLELPLRKKQCLVYADDVVLLGRTLREFVDALKDVFACLHKYDLRVNLKKCLFFVQKFTYLGHEVSAEGIRPDPEKVQSLKGYPRPTTARALSAFLGLTGWFRRFVPNFSSLAAPLHSLLAGSKKEKKTNRPLVWTGEAEAAFGTILSVVAARPVLAYPDLKNRSKGYYLYVDASGVGVGAVLMQESSQDQELHPVAFYSASLVDYEQNYNNPEREAMAVVHALRHFRPYLEGREVVVYTDCASVASFLGSTKLSLNLRLVRWSMEVALFDVKFRHVEGSKNPAADALSRYVQRESSFTLPIPSTPHVSHPMSEVLGKVTVAPVRVGHTPVMVAVRIENIIRLQKDDQECQDLVVRWRAAREEGNLDDTTGCATMGPCSTAELCRTTRRICSAKGQSKLWSLLLCVRVW